MAKQRLAVIDIGTIKTKFIVADFDKDNNKEIIYKNKILTVLGRNLQETGHISDQSLNKQLEILELFMQEIKDLHVNTLTVVGTESLRVAKNSTEVLKKIEGVTKVPTKVLTHVEEGKLFFKGVSANFNETIATANIGGGSVQLIIGNKDKIENTYLLKIGCHFIYEKFSKHNPPTLTEQDNTRLYVENEIKKLKILPHPGIKVIYGSSNIIEYFKEVGINSTVLTGVKNHPIKSTTKDLEAFFDKISSLTFEEREKLYPSEPNFLWGADKGAINISAICKALQTDVVVPTNINVSDGIMQEMLASFS